MMQDDVDRVIAAGQSIWVASSTRYASFHGCWSRGPVEQTPTTSTRTRNGTIALRRLARAGY
jgi:hypothetical protein